MQFSLLNLTALVAFCSWLMAVIQIEVFSRGACIFGSAAAAVVGLMVLALCSPVGESQLDVTKNGVYVVFASFSKFVIIFAAVTFLALLATSLFGYDSVGRWLR